MIKLLILFINKLIFNIKKFFFNHILIKKYSNIDNILNCININDWSTNRAKQNKIHENTKSINLIINNKILFNNKFKPIYKLIEQLNYLGNINSAKLIFLPKNKIIKPHIDGIRNNKKYTNYYDNYDRYHLVLDGKYELKCGNINKLYKKGDLYWFNNKKIHSVKSITDRISLIFDVDK